MQIREALLTMVSSLALQRAAADEIARLDWMIQSALNELHNGYIQNAIDILEGEGEYEFRSL